MSICDLIVELCVDFFEHDILKHLAILAHVLLGAAMLCGAYIYFRRVHLTHWWDLSKRIPNGPPDNWKMVDDLMKKDPMDHDAQSLCLRLRFFGLIRVVLEPLFAALLIAAWLLILSLICDWKTTSDDLKILGAAGGGVGILLTFAGVLYNGRLKARSENRQKWIDELREEIAKVIHAHPWFEDEKKLLRAKGGKAKIKKEVEQMRVATVGARARIELLLNPAELDHRALIALLRFFYRVNDIDIDKEAHKKLKLNDPDAIYQDAKRFKELKSGLIRLANAVFKREWEQVKHVR